MDDKRKLIDYLTPLYTFGKSIYVGFYDDYLQEPIGDGLLLEIEIENDNELNIPWSGQKIMKHNGAYMEPISKSERKSFLIQLERSLLVDTVSEAVQMLQHPPAESIESLVWKPERLRAQDENGL